MRASRRTSFAAPLVAVFAAPLAIGCSGGAAPTANTGTAGTTGTVVVPPPPKPPPAHPSIVWSVRRTGGQCVAQEWMSCPPDVQCNPPPPLVYACPDAGPAEFRVSSLDRASCVVKDTTTAIDCPHQDPPSPPPPPPPPPLRTWTLIRSGATCEAMLDSVCPPGPDGTMPPCNPPPPIKVDCGAVAGLTKIQEIRPGDCGIQQIAPCPPRGTCNPPPPRPLHCPGS